LLTLCSRHPDESDAGHCSAVAREESEILLIKETAMNARQLLGTLSISVALAYGSLVPESALADGPPARQGLEGTWMVSIHNAANGGVPFLLLATFTEEGQYLGETNTTAIRSLEHGDWFKVGPREYMRTSVNFSFAPPPAAPRTYTGLTRITEKLALNQAGDEYTLVAGSLERFDQNGNLISTLPSGGTAVGRRCDSSTSIPQCLGLGN